MATGTFSVQGTPEVQGRFQAIAPWLSRMVMMPPAVILTLLSFRLLARTAEAVPGATLNTPESFTDMRVPAAWLLTLLVLLLMFISNRRRLWLAHLQLCLFMGLTLAVRIYGFVHDGTTLAMGNQLRITIAESVFLVLNLAGLALQSYVSKQSTVQS